MLTDTAGLKKETRIKISAGRGTGDIKSRIENMEIYKILNFLCPTRNVDVSSLHRRIHDHCKALIKQFDDNKN